MKHEWALLVSHICNILLQSGAANKIIPSAANGRRARLWTLIYNGQKSVSSVAHQFVHTNNSRVRQKNWNETMLVVTVVWFMHCLHHNHTCKISIFAVSTLKHLCPITPHCFRTQWAERWSFRAFLMLCLYQHCIAYFVKTKRSHT